jgi:hypothetical protein
VSPSPNQTLVVNVPPDVVDRLTPHASSGLSQPWATIIAAVIALAAATIAYMGVRAQVRATASQAAATREAEERQAVRLERVRLLSDALEASNEVQRTVTDARSAVMQRARENVSADVYKGPKDQFLYAIAKATLAKDLLKISGLRTAADAVDLFDGAAINYANNRTGTVEEVRSARENMLRVFADQRVAPPTT